jgi:alginate biosynthesis protein AlgX
MCWIPAYAGMTKNSPSRHLRKFVASVAQSSCVLAALCYASVAMAKEQTPAKPEASTLEFHCPKMTDPQYQKRDTLVQAKEGWFLRPLDFNEHYQLLPETEQSLKRLNDAFAAQGAKLLIMAVPPRSLAAASLLDLTQQRQSAFDAVATARSYQQYLQSLRKMGIEVVDGIAEATAFEPQTHSHFFFKRDLHWTPFGANLIAQKLAKTLQKQPNFAANPAVQYQTAKTGMLTMKGLMIQGIQPLCEDTIPAEPYPEYTTSKQAMGEAALFDDASSAAPPLVLLGSSFSENPAFNFDGFLSQATGADIANFAIRAGELFNALVSYTSLPQAERLSPRFVIWEQLAHYDLNQGEASFRQAIPAIGGECSKEEAIASTTLTLKDGGSGELFTLPEASAIHGSDYYLFVSASHFGINRFTLQFDYADGDGEEFTVDRSQHFNNKGRFFVELSDELQAALTNIRISHLASGNATLDIRLCKRK